MVKENKEMETSLEEENINDNSGNCNCENCNCQSKECTCGTTQDAGCYVCCNCGQRIYLDDGQTLPPCPRCSNQTFTKE